MRAGWDALPDRMKARLEGLICEHTQLFSRALIGLTDWLDEERAKMAPVTRGYAFLAYGQLNARVLRSDVVAGIAYVQRNLVTVMHDQGKLLPSRLEDCGEGVSRYPSWAGW
jgi:hypothetical protein